AAIGRNPPGDGQGNHRRYRPLRPVRPPRRHLRQPRLGRGGLLRRDQPRGVAARREEGGRRAAGPVDSGAAEDARRPSDAERAGHGARGPLRRLCQPRQGQCDLAEGDGAGFGDHGSGGGAPRRAGRQGARTRTRQGRCQAEGRRGQAEAEAQAQASRRGGIGCPPGFPRRTNLGEAPARDPAAPRELPERTLWRAGAKCTGRRHRFGATPPLAYLEGTPIPIPAPKGRMPSNPRSRKSPRALPSREEVLAFIAEHPGQAGKREIARAFGVSGGDRIGLKALLKDLAADGLVERDRKRLKRPADLPSVAVLVVTGRDRDGELLAAPAEWPAGEDVPTFLVATDRKSKLPPPGVGDQVLARLTPAKDDAPASARVIKVLERKPATALGVFRTSPAGPRIEPVSRKEKALLVDPGATNGAQEGDLVSVTVTRSTRHGVDRARVTEVIGSLKSEKAVSLIAIHAHNIPNVFPPEVLAEAEKAKAAPLSGREDWRKMPLLTIDPPDAKDHDDAVHAEPDSDKANPGGFIVTVAIADVAWYVRPGSELDVEAVKRGNSVYFPDRVVPMLPERISNDLCSLREGEDRPALAVRMVFGSDGRKRSHRFHRIMMRSAGKLSYAEAQHVFDGGTSGPGNRVRAPLLALWDAYQVLARGRDEREPLSLDLPERKVIVGKDGGIERIIVPERLEAHRLIEEYMIQ